MPADCCTIFRLACNSSLGSGASRGRAFVAGYAAVRRSGWSKAAGESRFRKRLKIARQTAKLELHKLHEDARVFYAWATIVEKGGQLVSDHEGDGWSPAEMEKTAWRYAAGPGHHSIMHGELAGSDLVASMPFTHDLQKALEIDLGKVGWLVGYHVNDDALWERIKGGDLPMLSIHGHGWRESVAA